MQKSRIHINCQQANGTIRASFFTMRMSTVRGEAEPTSAKAGRRTNLPTTTVVISKARLERIPLG
jgi:hypothetical protein